MIIIKKIDIKFKYKKILFFITVFGQSNVWDNKMSRQSFVINFFIIFLDYLIVFIIISELFSK